MQSMIERIQKMERYFDEVSSAWNKDHEAVKKNMEIQKMFQELANYVESGQWLQDYLSDDRGEIPNHIKAWRIISRWII